MPVERIAEWLRILDERERWRRSELPPEITVDALSQLWDGRYVQIRRWEPNGPMTEDGYDGWVDHRWGNRYGKTMGEILKRPDFQGDCGPEFRVSPEGHSLLVGAATKQQSTSHAGKKPAGNPGRPRKPNTDKLHRVIRTMLDSGDVKRYDRKWKGELLPRYADKLPKKLKPDALRKHVEREEARRAADKK